MDNKYKKKRVIIVGNVDSGKSTLLGVLCDGVLDDGRGLARAKVCSHKHELESGRTSALFVTSTDVATFMDAPGHEKYNKTTARGMSALMPDYVICLVAANLGLTRMTREHLGMAVIQDLPVIVLVTKVDMAPKHILEKTMIRVKKLIGRTGRKQALVKGLDDLEVETLTQVSLRKSIPVMKISSVSGKNVDALRQMLRLLPDWRTFPVKDHSFSFSIDSKFQVPGIGIVVGGIVRAGKLDVGSSCWLGPYSRGNYRQVKVRSIYVTDEPNSQIKGGEYGTLAVRAIDGKKLTKACVRHGMILSGTKEPPLATKRFVADVRIMHHSTTIKPGYNPMMHCRGIRQSFEIVSIEKTNVDSNAEKDGAFLRTGDTGRLKCRFLQSYEQLEVGETFLFRESKARGVGKIVALGY
jgi:GTPase